MTSILPAGSQPRQRGGQPPARQRSRKPRTKPRVAKAAGGNARATKPSDDRRLVNDCVAGDPAAWETLFHRCHPALISITKLLLGAHQADANLVEEIVSRVWYALLTDPQRRLDPYDPRRGCSLTTFLAGLARNEIRQYFRAERRRKVREKTASCSEHRPDPLSARQVGLLIDEFLVLLTPRENQFLRCHLLKLCDDRAATFSDTNCWQLRHRISRKLETFLQEL